MITACVFGFFFSSSGLDIALFSRFKSRWHLIDLKQLSECVAIKKDHIVHYIEIQLEFGHPGDDNREFLILALVSFDEHGERQFRYWRLLVLRAKWMHCLKMFIFRNQFLLTAHEVRSLRQLNVFVVTIHLP